MVDYRALVEYIAKQLVTDPSSVEVTGSEGEEGLSVRILVAAGDVGRIIGKRGATINAIRQVVRASAAKAGDKVDVDVEERK